MKVKALKNNTSKILIAFLIILLMGAVNASILGSASTDKKTLGENEVAMLSVKLMNDSDKAVKGVNLRVTADDGIVFYGGEEESNIFIKTIDSINPGEVKELIIKLKAIEVKKQSANIYAYFGTQTDLRQAAVTMVETQPADATATAEVKIDTSGTKDTAIIDFALKNTSNGSLYKASAEALAPKDFEVKTSPLFEDKVLPGGTMEKTFNITIPIEASGAQKIIMAYGYFDDTNTPHYFEKSVTVNVQKINYPLIALLGIVVLVVAAYIFFTKGKGQGIKGTEKKEAEEKASAHKK